MSEPRKFNTLDNVMSDETRMALLEQSVGHVDETLTRIEKKFDRVEDRFDKTDSKIDSLAVDFKQGYKDLNERIWSTFIWTLSAGGTVLVFVALKLGWIHY